jgi:hypothetical protein
MSGGTAGHLSIEGDTAMYRYCEVKRGVQKCEVVRPAICLLKVLLQCTHIVRFKGGTEMLDGTAAHLYIIYR